MRAPLLIGSDEFYFDPVRILEIHGVGTSGVWMTVLVQDCYISGSEFARQSIDMRSRLSMKGEMIQPHSTSMIRDLTESILDLHEYDIGIAKLPTLTCIPVLVRLISESLKKPAPELDRSLKIADIDLDVMQHPSIHCQSHSPE